MKKIIEIFSLSLLVALFTGCNTVTGIGKDVSKGGQAIERAAQ
jgi:predicted small secreted protein